MEFGGWLNLVNVWVFIEPAKYNSISEYGFLA